jgi:hypothetical protein
VPSDLTDSALVFILAYDPSLNVGYDESDSLFTIGDASGTPGGRSAFGDEVCLWRNGTNPSGLTSSMSFYLPEGRTVFLEVFDATGRLVRTLIDGEYLEGGTHTIGWTGTDGNNARVSPGVYFVRLRAGRASLILKAVIAH